ncbi:unnamed protein product [Polarella glacialis]|uniref:Uncharacterized protein n=1 Tax=Polarella glacialis TaxID=89957 RepID=A0A813ET94_POLGL|nr:unnamed protein product [Polarella glacialis]
MWVIEDPTAMAPFWGAPFFLGSTITSRKWCQFTSESVNTRSVVGQHSHARQSFRSASQQLHGSSKRSGARLLRDWARANHFVREASRKALAISDEFEPTADGICGGCKSRLIWSLSSPNFIKPLEDHVCTGGQSQLMSLCTLRGIRCPATTKA